MRHRLFVGLLGIALLAAATFPSIKSGAARAPQLPPQSPAARQPVALPDFDLRLAGQGEFVDSDLDSTPSYMNA